MDFRQGSKVSLLLQLSAFHALVVGDPAYWTFSPPVALAGDDPSGENTKVKLTALRPNASYLGKQIFKYSRIQLADLQINLPDQLRFPLPETVTSTYEAFGFLVQRMGVLFSADDVEDLPVLDNGDGTMTIQLVAKPTSLMWLGATNIITSDLPPISMAIDPPAFDWS